VLVARARKLDALVLTEEESRPLDLAVFGYPPHPGFKKRMSPLDCRGLTLDFADLRGKRKFLDDFGRICSLRDRDMEEYHTARAKLLARANQPIAVLGPRRDSIPPALGKFDFGPTFPDTASTLEKAGSNADERTRRQSTAQEDKL
jgi:hypothetical protein